MKAVPRCHGSFHLFQCPICPPLHTPAGSQVTLCFCRIIVRMANYNQTTQEVARPSDLLAGVQTYVASLHCLSSYINVDVTRLVKSVLLQQTQPLDSRGGQTVTTVYTNWCVSLHGSDKAAYQFPDTCDSIMHRNVQEANTHTHAQDGATTWSRLLSLYHFLFSCPSSLTFILLNSVVFSIKLSGFCVSSAPQVPGESLATGEQLPHRPLSQNALLCQPDVRQWAEFQSGGVLGCVRLASEPNHSYSVCSLRQQREHVYSEGV